MRKKFLVIDTSEELKHYSAGIEEGIIGEGNTAAEAKKDAAECVTEAAENGELDDPSVLDMFLVEVKEEITVRLETTVKATLSGRKPKTTGGCC